VPTPQGDYAATLHTIENLVLSAEVELGQRGSVGVGTPGTISQATKISKFGSAQEMGPFSRLEA